MRLHSGRPADREGSFALAGGDGTVVGKPPAHRGSGWDVCGLATTLDQQVACGWGSWARSWGFEEEARGPGWAGVGGLRTASSTHCSCSRARVTGVGVISACVPRLRRAYRMVKML